MARTFDRVEVIQTTEWFEVMNVEGIVHTLNECHFAYSDTQPVTNFAGDLSRADVISNPSNSKLWLKPSWGDLGYIKHEY